MVASASAALQELGAAGASAFVLLAEAMRTANNTKALHNRHHQGRHSGLERAAHLPQPAHYKEDRGLHVVVFILVLLLTSLMYVYVRVRRAAVRNSANDTIDFEGPIRSTHRITSNR